MVCFAGAIALIVWGGLPERAEFTAFAISEAGIVAPETGAIAPPIEATTLDGTPIRLDALRGEVVIVNFWATWCGPCRFEMPELQRLYETQDNVRIIAVNLQEDEAEVQRWADAFGLTYPIVIDEGAIARRYAFRDPPTTFVIAPDGVIARTIYGPVTMESLEALVDDLAG